MAVHLLIGILVVALIAFLILWRLLERTAKLEVDDTPKVPMFMCDKHGMFPEKAAFDLNIFAEGRPDHITKVCPFCMDERIRDAELKVYNETHTSGTT